MVSCRPPTVSHQPLRGWGWRGKKSRAEIRGDKGGEEVELYSVDTSGSVISAHEMHSSDLSQKKAIYNLACRSPRCVSRAGASGDSGK